MESGAVWSAECREALAAVAASAADLAALAWPGTGADRTDAPGTGSPPGTGSLLDGGPLRELVDACLDGLAGLARLEAGPRR